ncbi:MAG: phage Gp37/Gp68 family protein [Actinomycetota bacterium]|nr:phage Gp37/Gp68 family protein [Actinomycetota bacterium]
MSSSTEIEWTEMTWNPVTGCDRVSPGCDHCYAQTLAKRLKAMGNPRYQRDGRARTSGPGFGVTMHSDKLQEPMRRTKPTVFFVNSMSDLFHASITTAFIDRVFDVMEATPQHTYQVLTKRPRRMAAYSTRRPAPPNVWLGTSVENQEWAEKRLPLLVEVTARVRFVSCEPLLGPIDLSRWIGKLSWVIVGGESGPRFREMNPDWARSLRDHCAVAGVPYFFKQWGGRTPKAGGRTLDGRVWDEMPRLESAG